MVSLPLAPQTVVSSPMEAKDIAAKLQEYLGVIKPALPELERQTSVNAGNLGEVSVRINKFTPVKNVINFAAASDVGRLFTLTNARKVVNVDWLPLLPDAQISATEMKDKIKHVVQERNDKGFMESLHGREATGLAGYGLLIPSLADIQLMQGKLVTPLDKIAEAVARGDKAIDIQFEWTHPQYPQDGPQLRTLTLVSRSDLSKSPTDMTQNQDLREQIKQIKQIKGGFDAVVIIAPSTLLNRENALGFAQWVDAALNRTGLILSDSLAPRSSLFADTLRSDYYSINDITDQIGASETIKKILLGYRGVGYRDDQGFRIFGAVSKVSSSLLAAPQTAVSSSVSPVVSSPMKAQTTVSSPVIHVPNVVPLDDIVGSLKEDSDFATAAGKDRIDQLRMAAEKIEKLKGKEFVTIDDLKAELKKPDFGLSEPQAVKVAGLLNALSALDARGFSINGRVEISTPDRGPIKGTILGIEEKPIEYGGKRWTVVVGLPDGSRVPYSINKLESLSIKPVSSP